jgi:hypothetical protein
MPWNVPAHVSVRHDACIAAERLARNALDPFRHLSGGPAREGHQQNSAWVGAVHNEMRHAARQRSRLPRAGPRYDQKRHVDRGAPEHAMLDCAALFRIEPIQV